MILVVKWTLGIVTILMAYMMMLTAMANSSAAAYSGIIRQIVI
jgi:hypothetical protein